jgi:hypothetical protein
VRPFGLGPSPTLCSHFPENVELDIALGWSDNLAINSSGVPSPTLTLATATFLADWPSEYFILGGFPDGDLALDGSGRGVWMCVQAPASSNRVFDLQAIPPHRMSLPAQVTVAAGNMLATFDVVGLSVGEVRVEARENGVLVAVSDKVTAVGASFLENVASGVVVNFGASGTGETTTELDSPVASETKLCVSRFGAGSPRQPVYSWCFPPQSGSNPEPSCPAEGSSSPHPPAIIFRDAECIGDPGECYIVLAPPSKCYIYRFHSKVKDTIGSTAVTIQAAPWGVGGSTTTLVVTTQWCCKYVYDPLEEPVERGENSCS